MVLYDVDKGDNNIQHLIKWIIGCYSDVCKLVLCCGFWTDEKSVPYYQAYAHVTHEVSAIFFVWGGIFGL